MPSIGELYRTEAIEWKGRRFTLARPSFATIAAFRDFMEKAALSAINRNLHLMSTAALKLQFEAWQASCAAKVYDFGTDTWNRAMESRENRCQWFWLVFAQPDLEGKPPKDAPSLQEVEGDAQAPGLADERAAEITAAWQRLMSPDPPKPPQQAAA